MNKPRSSSIQHQPDSILGDDLYLDYYARYCGINATGVYFFLRNNIGAEPKPVIAISEALKITKQSTDRAVKRLAEFNIIKTDENGGFIFLDSKSWRPIKVSVWLINGKLELQKPAQATHSTTEEGQNAAILDEFLQVYCKTEGINPKTRTAFKKLYGIFENHCIQHQKTYTPTQKKFSQLMRKRFKKDKIGGTVFFYGIELKGDYLNIGGKSND